MIVFYWASVPTHSPCGSQNRTVDLQAVLGGSEESGAKNVISSFNNILFGQELIWILSHRGSPAVKEFESRRLAPVFIQTTLAVTLK